MSMLDFSGEEEQREMNYGPVPAGSYVMVECEVMTPNNPASDNPNIAVAKSGLRQIYCQFTVTQGTYRGVRFRQNVTLPTAAQKIALTDRQATACRIGGATLKAMCVAAGKPPKIKDVTSLTGLKFPIRVKINQRPYEKDDGRVFWNNELQTVITPDMPEFTTISSVGEIINEGGAVTGNGTASSGMSGGGYNSPAQATSGSEGSDTVDEIPF